MDQIDHYKIIEKIGVGGMGEVYKGIDIMLEREVAIKLLRPELSSREDIVQRFRSEAVMLGRLNHPNIATVYNFGKFADQYYMALEFVNGQTLDSIISRDGAVSWRTAVEYTISVLEGLSHAHGFNIVHRDIKPSNIIICANDSVKILDFGIARILETARLTKTGHMIGTMEYVSPEQIQGRETDARSDIYSVGVTLYEMLTGHVPFQKDTEYDLIKAHVEERPKPLRALSGRIPAQLETIVLKALEKKPEKRFSDAREFSKALVLLRDGEHELIVGNHSANPVVIFCQDYPGLVFLFALLIVGGSYVAWDKNKIASNLTENVVAVPHKQEFPVVPSAPISPLEQPQAPVVESYNPQPNKPLKSTGLAEPIGKDFPSSVPTSPPIVDDASLVKPASPKPKPKPAPYTPKPRPPSPEHVPDNSDDPGILSFTNDVISKRHR